MLYYYISFGATNNELMKKGKYKHYKGKNYELVDEAIHSETHEKMVVYRPLYGEGKLWVRPAAMFFENVIINGKEIPRFEFIG